MPGTVSRTRIAVALGLVLFLGTVGELPHGHAEAEISSRSALAPVELHRSGPAAVEDDAPCAVCVLQRLLSQARAASPNAFQEPGATATLVRPPALDVAECVLCSGSPRGPPLSA